MMCNDKNIVFWGDKNLVLNNWGIELIDKIIT